jgi:multidrug efflux pump subunit AcrB
MAQGAELSEGLGIVWALPEVKDMPAGTRIQETGDAEIMGEVFAGFATAMGTGIMLVLVVLILLFGSVFHSFTILGSLPLAIGGVVAGLWLTNSAVSMPVVIGILMLMGIVTKNAIMLVDFAVEEVKQGVSRSEAIIDAGRKRARPIVMTTIAMSAGMIPAALALGDGGEFRAPMAIAVVGGLLVSTLLSLVFVPSFYTIMDDAAIGTARLFRWLVKPNRADEPDAEHIGNVHLLPKREEFPVAAE